MAANVVGTEETNHLFYAMSEFPFPVFVDVGRKYQMLSIFAPSRKGDIGRLSLWDESQQPFLAQVFQYHVHLLLRLQPSLFGYVAFIDETIVGEESSVVAQHGIDDCVFLRSLSVQAVEFVAADDEMYTRLVVAFFFVVDVARLRQNVERGFHTNGEMLVDAAEFVDVELKGCIGTTSHTYLIIVGEMFVHLPDFFFWRICAVNALMQFMHVVIIAKKHGIGFLPIATCAAGFLEVGFRRIWAVVVNHKAHIGLVDAHAKGVGRHDHARFVVLPLFLSEVAFCGVEAGMIGQCRDVFAVE